MSELPTGPTHWPSVHDWACNSARQKFCRDRAPLRAGCTAVRLRAVQRSLNRRSVQMIAPLLVTHNLDLQRLSICPDQYPPERLHIIEDTVQEKEEPPLVQATSVRGVARSHWLARPLSSSHS